MAILILLFVGLVAPKCSPLTLSDFHYKSPTPLFPPPPPYLPPYYPDDESPILNTPLTSPHPPPHASFDFFMLAQTWPTSFCKLPNNYCVNKPASPVKFSIHGLWPQNKKGQPACVPTVKFDFNKVSLI